MAKSKLKISSSIDLAKNSKHKKLINKLVELRDAKDFNEVEFEKCKTKCVVTFAYMVSIWSDKYRQFSNHEDLYQEGMIALLSALKTYHPDKGDWYWWAHKYISTKIYREANKHSVFKVPLKKAVEIRPQKVYDFAVIDTEKALEYYVDQIIEAEKSIEISEALQRLATDQATVIKKIYGLEDIKPQTINSIAKELGITKDECDRIFVLAKNELKEILSTTN